MVGHFVHERNVRVSTEIYVRRELCHFPEVKTASNPRVFAALLTESSFYRISRLPWLAPRKAKYLARFSADNDTERGLLTRPRFVTQIIDETQDLDDL